MENSSSVLQFPQFSSSPFSSACHPASAQGRSLCEARPCGLCAEWSRGSLSDGSWAGQGMGPGTHLAPGTTRYQSWNDSFYQNDEIHPIFVFGLAKGSSYPLSFSWVPLLAMTFPSSLSPKRTHCRYFWCLYIQCFLVDHLFSFFVVLSRHCWYAGSISNALYSMCLVTQTVLMTFCSDIFLVFSYCTVNCPCGKLHFCAPSWDSSF